MKGTGESQGFSQTPTSTLSPKRQFILTEPLRAEALEFTRPGYKSLLSLSPPSFATLTKLLLWLYFPNIK